MEKIFSNFGDKIKNNFKKKSTETAKEMRVALDASFKCGTHIGMPYQLSIITLYKKI